MSQQPLRLIVEAMEGDRPKVVAVPKEDGQKSYYIEGVFLQGNVKNKNGRIYPTDLLAEAVRKYDAEFIQRRRAFGELGHPETPTVNMDRASHIVTSLVQEGNDFIGKALINTETPMGKIVKSWLDIDAEFAVSSRGVGSVQESGGVTSVNEYLLAAVDIVTDPSAPKAFVQGIMEGRAWVLDNGLLTECVMDKLTREIEIAHVPTISSAEKQQRLVEAFSTFMDGLHNSVHVSLTK